MVIIMEYCRRTAFTKFFFYKAYPKCPYDEYEQFLMDLKDSINTLEGGEYFFDAVYEVLEIRIVFYFYDPTDLLLVKLSI